MTDVCFAANVLVRLIHLSIELLFLGDQMLVLLGKISCSVNTSEMTCSSRRGEQKVRERPRANYWLEGQQICRDTFKFLHG